MFEGFSGNLTGSIIAYLGIHDVNFSSKLNEANQKADKFAKTISTVMNQALIAGSSAFAASVLAAAKYEQQMALVNTLLGESSKGFEQLKKSVIEISTKTPDSITNLSKGLYDLISSGADAANAIDSLALASKAAVAGMTSTEVAIQAGMATINAYGLRMEALNRIYDLQFQAVNYGVMTYEQLANAVGNILPMAAALGVKLDEVYGALAFITKAGIDATSAATYLSRAFQSMIENQDKWAALGISIFDVTGSFAGLGPIIEQLAGKLDGLNKQQQMTILQSLGMEERAAKAIRTMVSNYEGFVETMNNTAQSAGAMEIAFSKTYKTFENQSKIFRNIIQSSFIETGSELLPLISSILSIFNRYPETVKLVVKEFSAMAMIAMTLTAAFKAYNFVASLVPQLNKLAASSFGPIGIAITALSGTIILFANLIEKQKEKEKQFFENMAKGIIDIDRLEHEYRKISATIIDVESAHKKTEEAQKKLNEAIANGNKNIENYRLAYEKAKEEEENAIILKSRLQDVAIKLEKAYKDQGISISTLSEKFGELGEEQKKLKHDQLIAELKQLQIEFEKVSNTSKIYVSGWLDFNSGRYIEGFERVMTAAEKAAKLEELSNKMQRVRNALEMLNAPSEEIKEKFEKIGSMSEKTKGQIEAKIKALEALRPEISGNAELSKQLSDRIEELKEKYQLAAQHTGLITEKQKLLKDAGIETTAEVRNQIAELQKLYPIIKEDDYAIYQYNQRLEELEKKIEPAVIAQEKLKNIGIETSDAIRAQIKELERHRPEIEGDAYAIQQYNEKMKELQDKIDPVIIAQKELKSAGIETSDMIQQQIADLEKKIPLVEGDEYATAQLNKKIAELKTKLEEASPAYMAFYEAGLQSSHAIKDQIASMEQAIPAAQGDSLAMGELLIKTKDLYEKLGDASGFDVFIQKTGLSKQAALELMNGIHNTAQKVGFYAGELANAIDKYDLFGDKTNIITGEIHTFAEKLKETHTSAEQLGYWFISLGDIISGVSDETNIAARAFGVLSDVIGTAITSGFNPFSIAISAVTGIFSLFNTKQREVNRTLEEVIEIVKRAGINIEEFEKKIKNLKFESPLIDNLKADIDRILESMRTAVGKTFEMLESQLKKLTDQINELTKPFEFKVEIQKAVENVYHLIDEINTASSYLGIENLEAFNTLLQSQLTYLMNILDNVQSGTPAYEELRKAIDAIIASMANLNKTQDNTIEYFQKQKASLLDQITLNESYILQLQERLNQENLEIEESVYLHNELQRALDLNREYEKELDKINRILQENSNAIKDNSEELNENANEVRELSNALHEAIRAISNYRREIHDINADGIGEMTNNIRNAAISIYDLNDKFQQSYKILQNAISEIKKLSEYYGNFDARSLINQLQEQIILNLQLLKQLPEGSRAYQDLGQAIMQAYGQMLSLGGSADAVLATAMALNIDLSKLTRSHIEHSNAIQMNIKSIKGYADAAFLAAKANESIQRRLNILNEELEKEKLFLNALRDQKISLQVEFQARKEKLEEEISEWRKKYESLTAEKAEINLEFDIQIGDLSSRIGSLQDIFEQLDRGDIAVNFYNIAAAIRDLSGASIEFKANWENALSVMFSDYETFTMGLKKASDALDQLNYFAIGFDQTNVDEQIALMIFQMKGFLDNLDPNSAAFRDAKKAMDELILKFLKLSDQAIPEAYQSLIDNMSQLNNELTVLQERKVQIDLDINTLNERKKEILKRIDDINNRKIQINIELEKNIKEINDQINFLRGNINNLEAKKIEIDVELRENIQEANKEIAALNANLDDYSRKRENIISQTESINRQINQLTEYFNLLSSTDPAALANVSLNQLYHLLIDINGEVDSFSLTWESAWQTAISDFSKFFEYDAKSEVWGLSKEIENIFEQIRFFKIDFNTTEMDEKLNALIFRMKSYIQELNPESEAYAQANAALQNFIDKFIEMGGILDEEAAKAMYSEKTESSINLLQEKIKQLTEEKNKIDLDITEALNKIQEIQQRIQDMRIKAEEEKVKINLEISKAQDEINTLLITIDDLRKKAIEETLQLENEFVALDAEILKIDEKLIELEQERLKIDADIPKIHEQINSLQAQIDQFDLTQFLDQQAAMNAQIDITNQEIGKLDAMLNSIIQKKDEYNISIDAKIDEAVLNITNLEQQLVELQNDFATVDLQLDVDISNAIDKINQLQNSINSLSGTVIQISGSGSNIYIQVNPEEMHTGGIIKAHSGLLNWDERLIIGQVGEAVIPRDVVRKYPIAAWQSFIQTGDIDSLRDLKKGKHQHLDYHFTFHNVPIGMDIVDGPIYDRISYRRRKLEASGNPYA